MKGDFTQPVNGLAMIQTQILHSRVHILNHSTVRQPVWLFQSPTVIKSFYIQAWKLWLLYKASELFWRLAVDASYQLSATGNQSSGGMPVPTPEPNVTSVAAGWPGPGINPRNPAASPPPHSVLHSDNLRPPVWPLPPRSCCICLWKKLQIILQGT